MSNKSIPLFYEIPSIHPTVLQTDLSITKLVGTSLRPLQPSFEHHLPQLYCRKPTERQEN